MVNKDEDTEKEERSCFCHSRKPGQLKNNETDESNCKKMTKEKLKYDKEGYVIIDNGYWIDERCNNSF